MTYFVYIESPLTPMPHRAQLTADCPTAAAVEALEHLRTHSQAVAAHVYEGNTCVASVRREQMGL